MTAPARQDLLFEVLPDSNAPDPTPPPAKKPPAQRESDGVCAIYLAATGTKYKYQGPKDAEAWKRMRAVAEVPEIEARWRIGLSATGFKHVDTLAQLDAKWNDLAPLLAPADRGLKAETYDCQSCAAVVNVDLHGRFRDERGWLCIKCFDVGRPTNAELDAKLGAVQRKAAT